MGTVGLKSEIGCSFGNLDDSGERNMLLKIVGEITNLG
jgi:hypothetical protein